MVECGICLEEYQEADLELHRQMCEVRLMFRCSLCNGDYVSKEGLWNHLDLHEIADEVKELQYQEIKAKHKLHQCVLCNDQRAYSEICYWKHVHDIHDDFFLKCSDCGENFRSEKFKNDHASSGCKARDPMEEEQIPVEDGNMSADSQLLKLLLGDQSSNTIEEPDNRLSVDYADKNISDKESELPPINLPPRYPCDNCGKSFVSEGSRLRHKAAKYACMEGSSSGTKCFRCNKEYISARSLRKHIIHQHQLTKCGICGITFEGYSQAYLHKKDAHAETLNTKEKFTCIALYKHHTNVCDPVQNDSSSHKSADELILKDTSDPKVVIEKKHKFVYIYGSIVVALRSQIHRLLGNRTCGRKFHCKTKFNKYGFECDHKMYSCKLCGSTFKQFYSFKQHTKRYHPDESNLQNIQIVQDQKQAQNIDIKMEITVEETTISTRDDEGLSSVNLSSDVLDSRSNEQSSAYLSEDEIMDSQVIDKGSLAVSVSEEISKPLDENLSNQPYFCYICGIPMHSYYQFKYHRTKKHKEGRHQCPNCSRKFHYKSRLEEHVSRCASFKHSCELCGQKFKFQSRVDEHKKRVHHSSIPLRDANIEATDCTEEKNQGSVEKIDAAEEMISCIVCRISFTSDELWKHMLNCPKRINEYNDDSQFRTEDISLLHGVSETQVDPTIDAQGEITDVKLEIEVEETLLQEQRFEVPNEKLERSSATTLTGAEVIGPANLIELGYVPVKACSFEDAKFFVKNFEFGFGLHSEKINKNGSKRYYRCLRVKQSVRPQCERKVLMFTPNVNETSTVCAKGEHNCMNAPPGNLKRASIGVPPRNAPPKIKAVPAEFGLDDVPVKTCSFEDAKLFVKNFEFGFGMSSQRINKNGSKRYYRCLRVKQSVRPQCERKVLMFTPNVNETSTVCAKGEHSCINAPPENLVCVKAKPSVEQADITIKSGLRSTKKGR